MVGSLSTVVLSVRVRRELKEEAERLGIDLREAVERALEEEIRRMKKLIGEALVSMDLDVEEWVKTVREMRIKR